MKLAEAVGKRLNDILTERNMTQYGLSVLGGIPRQTINIVVKGLHDRVALETIYQITETLGMTLEEFFADPVFREVTD